LQGRIGTPMNRGMHVPPPQSTDISERRRRIGASRETMAAGIGLSVDDVRAVENGSAPDALRAQYVTWLGRVESWSAKQRQEQLFAAGTGRRFEQ
jgi:DNA-binding XRE family transcriptional regulator